MIGIILAAGIASRLRPHTNSTPKCLLPVGGTPLLERTLRALDRSGISECVIVTGYYGEKVERFAAALGLSMSIRYVVNSDYASTNNNYSLWMAGRSAAGRDILLMDADILFDRRLIPLLLDAPHENALIMRSSGNVGQEEIKLELVEGGRVKYIGKEMDPARAAGESVGIEKFSAATASVLFHILERRKVLNEFYEASFQEMIDGGCPVYAVDSGPYACMEIDTPDDLAAAEETAAALEP